jgi:hypothetical protein
MIQGAVSSDILSANILLLHTALQIPDDHAHHQHWWQNLSHDAFAPPELGNMPMLNPMHQKDCIVMFSDCAKT